MSKSSKTEAQNTFMSFKYQEVYAIIFLLDPKYKKYEEIMIEFKDDIYLIGNKNDIICQLKTIETIGKRITNASESLWKTIYNWSNYIKNELISEQDELMLLLQNDEESQENDFAQKISKANSKDEINQLYEEFTEWYNENYIKKEKEATDYKRPEIRNYLDEIFSKDNVELTKLVIKNFNFVEEKKNCFLRIKNFLHTSEAIPDSLFDDYLLSLLGWISKLIITSDNKVIVREEYDKFKKDFLENRIIIKKLNSYIDTIDINQKIGETQERNPLFLKELLKLSLNDYDIIESISDYVSVLNDREHYALDNLISISAIDDHDNELHSYWKSEKEEIELTNEQSLLIKSNIIRLKCMKYRINLDGIETPYYFTKGSYHYLADLSRIYWWIDRSDNDD